MNNQPEYHEPLLYFDQYTVVWKEDQWQVIQMFKNLSWLAAELTAGCEATDFCTSIERSGWLGTCPQWNRFKPVVTVPRGESLDLDHIDFIMGALT